MFWLFANGFLCTGRGTMRHYSRKADNSISASPTAAELQVVYDTAVAEAADIHPADLAYDQAQTAVSDLRPRADALIKAVRANILFSTYEMDAASQRRVLRNHGATFRYLPNETVDEGDETAVVPE